MLAGLLWKPWLRGVMVTKRKKANGRNRIVRRVILGGFFVLNVRATTLGEGLSTPVVNILVKWAKSFWMDSGDFFSKLCALACLSAVQSVFDFNLELATFFNKYGCRLSLVPTNQSCPLVSQRKKRFFFIRQRPKRFILWY